MFQRRVPEGEAIDGLRERKKRETRSALAWSAVRLAVEHGFANVRVEDIAAGAGVSPRTFNNYFSSKAEAIVARHVDRLQAVAAELRAQPADAEIWAALCEAAISQFAWDDDDAPPHPLWSAGVKLMVSEPAVQAELLHRSRLVEHEISVAIAARLGGDDALSAGLIAAAVGAVIHVSLEQWLASDQRLSLGQVMRRAFERMGHVAGARRYQSVDAP
jgi:AcrR family transcriptional regulator